MSFKATDQRVYVTNVRIPVFDQNSEETRVILQDVHDISAHALRTSITGTVATNISGQTILVGNFPATQGVTGTVNVGNFPAVQGVTGTVNIGNPVTISGVVDVSGSFSANISGQTVLVGNFPATQGVTGTVNISGQYVNVSNFPAVQGVTGTVNIGNPVTISGVVDVSGSFSANISGQTVLVGNFPATQGVTGTVDISGQYVNVSNFPATQGVTGTVNVGNFPAIQGVTGTVNISGQYINVSNFPATQGVTGTVNVGNFPAVQGVTGTVNISGQYVNVSNFPATQGVTGTVNIGDPITISGTTLDAGRLNVYDSSSNATLTTIEANISGGVLAKGLDADGLQQTIYVDPDGIQRTEIVTGHVETAKYVFETDASVIASSSGAGWSIDARGRKGWKYDAVAVSTLDWYNGITAPPSVNKNKLQAHWFIACLDTTTQLPKVRLTTPFSVWEYYLPASAYIYSGETYLFYFGAKAIGLHPNYHPQEMVEALISGPGLSTEAVLDIQVVSTTSGSNGSNFLIQSAGIWNQDLAQRFEVVFDNVRDFTAETKLGTLDFSGTSLRTVITNFPATQPVSIASTVTVQDFSAENSLISINNRQIITPFGSRGNIANSVTIAGWADTTALFGFDTANNFGIDCVFSYEDTATSATGDIAILGSLNGSAWNLIGLVTPVLRYSTSGLSTGRWATTRLNVAPFRYLAIRNVGSVSLTGVVSSVLAGKPAGAV